MFFIPGRLMQAIKNFKRRFRRVHWWNVVFFIAWPQVKLAVLTAQLKVSNNTGGQAVERVSVLLQYTEVDRLFNEVWGDEDDEVHKKI